MLAVIVFYLLVNVPGIYIPVVINAAKYAQVGREILDNNDWINLTIASDAYDQKPPLLFWIAASVFSVFGLSIKVYKTIMLLISLIGIFGTYRLGKLLYDKKTGILAALFWATCLGYVHFHNDIHTDALLVVTVILAIWQYAEHYKNGKEYQFYLGTLFVGLSMLTKGPIGLVIPATAVGSHLLLKRDFKNIINYRWIISIPIIAIIILPALWGLFNQFGLEGIKFYFWTNNMGRITGSYHGRNTDLFYYLHTGLYMFAPWAIFSFMSIILEIREKIQKKWNFTKNDEFFILGGILFYFIIFSIARNKNPHYMQPILPLMSLLSAKWVFKVFDTNKYKKVKKIAGTLNLILGILIWPAIAFLVGYALPEKRPVIWIIIILLASCFIYILTRKKSLYNQIAYLLIAITALLFTLNTSILPQMTKFHSSFEACEDFNKYAKENEKLHIFTIQARYWDIFLYSKNYGRYIITKEDYEHINPPVNDWIFSSPEGVDQLKKMNIEFDVVNTYNHRSLSRVTPKFINPKTRESSLRKSYLLKIKE